MYHAAEAPSELFEKGYGSVAKWGSGKCRHISLSEARPLPSTSRKLSVAAQRGAQGYQGPKARLNRAHLSRPRLAGAAPTCGTGHGTPKCRAEGGQGFSCATRRGLCASAACGRVGAFRFRADTAKTEKVGPSRIGCAGMRESDTSGGVVFQGPRVRGEPTH